MMIGFPLTVSSQSLEPMSLRHDGTLSPYWANDPFLSGNGRFVVFVGNDLAADDGGGQHVYLYDRVEQELERVDEAWDGGPASGAASLATNRNARVVTNDGRWVFFLSNADDLIQGKNAAQRTQLWARDRVLGVNHLVSQASDGAEADAGAMSDYSAAPNMPRAIFNSISTNLDADDTDSTPNTFWRDVLGGNTRLACMRKVVDARGGDVLEKVDFCNELTLSCGGQFMAFTTSEDGLAELDETFASYKDLYAGNVFSGDYVLLTRDHLGAPASHSYHRAASIDCANRRVAFVTASALSSSDPDNDWDLYVRDIVSEQVWWIDLGTNLLDQAVISSNGAHVAFTTSAALDVVNDQNGSITDVYRIDFAGDIPSAPILVSLHNGQSPNLNVEKPTVADSGAVAFASGSTNLMPFPEFTPSLDIFATGALSEIFTDGFESGNSTNWSGSP